MADEEAHYIGGGLSFLCPSLATGLSKASVFAQEPGKIHEDQAEVLYGGNR